MKIDLGYGATLEPDEGPRDTPFHKRIVSTQRIPNTQTGRQALLECGHLVMAFGNIEHANGVALCTKCRDEASGPPSEIGRELKVSELRPKTVVVLAKTTRVFAATMWVDRITDAYVWFWAQEIEVALCLKRCGPDLEQVEDDEAPMKIYEYLGVV